MNCSYCSNPTSPMMKKCVHCGKEIIARAVRDDSQPIDCPVCNKRSDIISFASAKLDVCQQCGGVWFDNGEIQRLQDPGINQILSGGMKRSLQRLPRQSVETKRSFYLDCPVCGELMLRRNFMDVSGIMLDTCVNDGVWVKRNDVLRILEIVGSEKIRELTHKSEMFKKYEKQIQERRLREAEAKRQERQREIKEADAAMRNTRLLYSPPWLFPGTFGDLDFPGLDF